MHCVFWIFKKYVYLERRNVSSTMVILGRCKLKGEARRKLSIAKAEELQLRKRSVTC